MTENSGDENESSTFTSVFSFDGNELPLRSTEHENERQQIEEGERPAWKAFSCERRRRSHNDGPITKAKIN